METCLLVPTVIHRGDKAVVTQKQNQTWLRARSNPEARSQKRKGQEQKSSLPRRKSSEKKSYCSSPQLCTPGASGKGTELCISQVTRLIQPQGEKEKLRDKSNEKTKGPYLPCFARNTRPSELAPQVQDTANTQGEKAPQSCHWFLMGTWQFSHLIIALVGSSNICSCWYCKSQG